MGNELSGIAEILKSKGLMLATAESCTGGGIAEYCTSIAGSSDWFDCAVVTYSNRAKQKLLGVKDETLVNFGAVSHEVATEMVAGLIANTDADVGISVTGIAGPGGGTEFKPVGTVYIAWGGREKSVVVKKFQFPGDRETVRKSSVNAAVTGLVSYLQE
jgi:nicotinamide-nucleotide amidase